MIESFLNFEKMLGERFGFDFVIHFEDSIVLVAGILIGMVIMSFLCGRVTFELRIVKSLGSQKLKLVKIKNEGVRQYVAAPKNVSESVETLLLVIFRPLMQYKNYTYRDERRTKILIIILIVATILLIALAIICTSTIVVDGQ